MADEQRRGKGREQPMKTSKRWSFLNDYQKTAGGDYVYTGRVYTLGDAKRYRRKLSALSFGAAAVTVGSGCINAAGLSNTFYVILPYIGEVAAVFVLCWQTVKLLAAGREVKAYVRDTLEKYLPPAALALIRDYAGVLYEVEGLKYGGCFTRDGSRDVSAEHTLVLQGEKLQASLSQLGVDTAADPAKAAPLAFEKENAPRVLSDGEGASLHIEYSSAYTYDFRYDPAGGNYAQSLNGAPVSDAEGVPCAYTNVFVLYVDTVDLGDSDGHLDLLLENGGEGYYLYGGRYEKIRWEKGGDRDPLRLLTPDGAPLTLNPGNSYIGFVRSARAERTVLNGGAIG